MGKSNLLYRYINRNSCFHHSPTCGGKKTFNNRHGSNQMIVLKVQ